MTKSRKGFTLIELIFTIVIIGVLAAVAIPKYQDLKNNATINGIVKVISSAKSSIPSAYANAVYLEGTSVSQLKLKDIFSIKGENWSYNNSNYYAYKTPDAQTNIVSISLRLNPKSKLFISVYCDNFSEEKLVQKCKDKYPTNYVDIFDAHYEMIELE